MIEFAIWSIVGLAFIGIGISSIFSKKPAGFWANVEVEQVTDVRKYNREVGRLFIVYGVIFIVLGTPMLLENPAYIIFSILGIMAESIGAMIYYSQVISEKYKVK